MKALVALLLLGQVVIFKDGAPVARETKRINFKGDAISCAASFMGVDCTIDAGVAGGGSSWDGGPAIPTCSAGQVVFADGGQFSCVTDADTLHDAGVWGAYGGAAGVNVAAPGTTLASHTLTVAAGDSVRVSVWGLLFNNSGGTRTYTGTCLADSTTLMSLAWPSTLATSTTTRSAVTINCTFGIVSTGETLTWIEQGEAGSNNTGFGGTKTWNGGWATAAADWTGSHTFKVSLSSNSTTATQTFYVVGYKVEHLTTP